MVLRTLKNIGQFLLISESEVNMKNHFAEYNDLKIKLAEYNSRIDVLKEKLYSVSGVSYDDAPRVRSSNGSIIYKIQEIDELVKERDEIESKLNLLYVKHVNEIDVLKSEMQRSILRSFYLHRIPVKNIARSYGVTDNHISRIKSLAVREFKKKILKMHDSA